VRDARSEMIDAARRPRACGASSARTEPDLHDYQLL
jgi:hypothetical protein